MLWTISMSVENRFCCYSMRLRVEFSLLCTQHWLLHDVSFLLSRVLTHASDQTVTCVFCLWCQNLHLPVALQTNVNKIDSQFKESNYTVWHRYIPLEAVCDTYIKCAKFKTVHFLSKDATPSNWNQCPCWKHPRRSYLQSYINSVRGTISRSEICFCLNPSQCHHGFGLSRLCWGAVRPGDPL